MYSLVFTFLCQTVRYMGNIGCKIMQTTRDWVRRPRQLPGPDGVPVFGNMLQIDTKKMQHECTKWSKKFGNIFQFKLLGRKVVVISEANTLNKCLTSPALSPHTNDRGVTSTTPVFFGRKHIGLADYNTQTHGLRQILKLKVLHAFAGLETFENSYKSVMNKFVAKLKDGSESEDLNPDQLVKDFLTDLNSIILIGETLPENDPDQGALWDLIDNLYTLLDPSIDAPLRMFPFLRFLPVKHGRIFRATIKARDKVSQRYLDTQKATYEEGRVRGLVDVCLKIQHEERMLKGESWLSDDYIKGLMYDTVAAGMSEMMKSIRMLILLMCHYQDVQSRVQTEIDDVIGVCATPASNHRQEMPFTHAVILEMLRYVSQTPLAIPHKCNKDVLLDGYLIEKNAGIFPNIWGIHHDEDVWGDPWVFRPERFLTENGQLLPKDHRHMKSLIPFSVGKRRCPGEDFAMSRLFLVLTAMLQKLTFEPPQQTELPSVDPRLYSNMYPLHLPVFSCRAVRRPRETQI